MDPSSDAFKTPNLSALPYGCHPPRAISCLIGISPAPPSPKSLFTACCNSTSIFTTGKKRHQEHPPTPTPPRALAVHHCCTNWDAGAGRHPWGLTSLCTLSFSCGFTNTTVSAGGLFDPETGTQVTQTAWDLPGCQCRALARVCLIYRQRRVYLVKVSVPDSLGLFWLSCGL